MSCPRCGGAGWLRLSRRLTVVCPRWDCPGRPASARHRWFDPAEETHQPRPTPNREDT